MKNLLIRIVLLSTLFSCTQPQSGTQDLNCIQISFDDIRSINFLDAFEIIKVIPLQTIEESLITRISKIEFHDGDFYLFNTNMNDPVFKEVMQFDSTGLFLHKLTTSINAVSDFRYASDFLIEDNSILFLEGLLKN